MSGEYDLHYFQVRSRGEPVRLLINVAEKGVRERQSSQDEWEDRKEKILAKRFPLSDVTTSETHGTSFMQSLEIFRYVASELLMCGASEEDIAKTNQIVEALNNIFNEIGGIRFSKMDKKEKENEYSKYLEDSKAKETLNGLVTQLGNNGNNFFLGCEVSAADVFYLPIMQFVVACYPEALRYYSTLGDYTNRIVSFVK